MSPLKIGQLVIVVSSIMLPQSVGKIGEVVSNKKVFKTYNPRTYESGECVGYLVKFPSPIFYSTLHGKDIYEVVFYRENLKPISDPDADTSDSTESDWKVKPPIHVVRENPCVELLKDIT
jgi:hypothetical protein